MLKKIISFIICVSICLGMAPAAHAEENLQTGENLDTGCYIATTQCPQGYMDYANDNISKFVFSVAEDLDMNKVSVGEPFAFADAGSDVYYFPILEGSNIKYLFRVYPDGDSYSAAISKIMAEEINEIAEHTTANNPMQLRNVEGKLTAYVGSDEYIMFEYPKNMPKVQSNVRSNIELTVVNAKSQSEVQISMNQPRDIFHVINLDITETQDDDSWCNAYCLATIIRTLTDRNANAQGLVYAVLGVGTSIDTPFPWNKIEFVANGCGLNATVLDTKATNSELISEIYADRPCIVAMTTGSINHAMVLRGYSTQGLWSVWNPWFDYCEHYSVDGTYVPSGYPSGSYSFRPYRHAYGFTDIS